FLERALPRHGDDRVVARSQGLEPPEELVGQRHRRDAPRAHEGPELAERQEDRARRHERGGASGKRGSAGPSAFSSGTARRVRTASTIVATPFCTASSWAAVRRSPYRWR